MAGPYGDTTSQLTFQQIEQAWVQGGGNPDIAQLMAQVAELESGGHPGEYVVESNGQGGTQTSNGLWQISTGTLTQPDNWQDPATNAALAVQKLATQGWGAWQNTVAKLQAQGIQFPTIGELPGNVTAGGNAGSDLWYKLGGGNLHTNILDPTQVLGGDLFQKIFGMSKQSWSQKYGAYSAFILVGIVLVLVGALLIMRE